MVQLITDKRRSVFTNVEWFLMKFLFLISGAIAGSLITACILTDEEKTQPLPVKELKEVVPAPVHLEMSGGKHFDCQVEDIVKGENGDNMYVTECGVPFYSRKTYKIGQKIKGFKSPKHE